jgi:hypothetical protein
MAKKIMRRIEITPGQKFGEWTIIREVGGYPRNFLCKCSCGLTKEVRLGQLRRGQSKSCGCVNKVKITPGQKFGEWTVIRKIGGRETILLCECSCGVKREVYYQQLKSGHSKSCGHNRKRIEITPGQKFGRWTVIQEVEGNRRSFLCKCFCGNNKKIDLQRLRKGKPKSCGCLNRVTPGERFGEWTIIREVEGKRRKVLCECSCGVKREVFLNSLKRDSKSCGCRGKTLKGNYVYGWFDRDTCFYVGRGVNNRIRVTHRNDDNLAQCEVRRQEIGDRFSVKVFREGLTPEGAATIEAIYIETLKPECNVANGMLRAPEMPIEDWRITLPGTGAAAYFAKNYS